MGHYHVKPSNYFGDKSVGFRGGDVRLVEGLPEVPAEELEAGGELAEGLETAAVPGAELRGREVIHAPDEVRSADVFFTQGFQDPETAGVHVVEEPVEKILYQAVPLRVGEVQPQAVGFRGRMGWAFEQPQYHVDKDLNIIEAAQ